MYALTPEEIGDQIERQALAKACAHLLALGLSPEDLAPCLTADNAVPREALDDEA